MMHSWPNYFGHNSIFAPWLFQEIAKRFLFVTLANVMATQQVITSSKLTAETREQGVKYVQS